MKVGWDIRSEGCLYEKCYRMHITGTCDSNISNSFSVIVWIPLCVCWMHWRKWCIFVGKRNIMVPFHYVPKKQIMYCLFMVAPLQFITTGCLNFFCRCRSLSPIWLIMHLVPFISWYQWGMCLFITDTPWLTQFQVLHFQT